MYNLSEIAEDVYRISVFVPEFNLAFNHFLVKDDEPLLFHAGLRGMFPLVREAVAKVIDPSSLHWIQPLRVGRVWRAQPLAGDRASVSGRLRPRRSAGQRQRLRRPSGPLAREDTLSTGKRRFRFLPTPHIPHGWDAGLMFEETGKTLFTSDLFVQGGDREPLTTNGLIDRCRADLITAEGGPFAGAMPYTHRTGEVLKDLASFQPQTLAIMHGSSYSGDGAKALTDLAGVLKEVLGPK